MRNQNLVLPKDSRLSVPAFRKSRFTNYKFFSVKRFSQRIQANKSDDNATSALLFNASIYDYNRGDVHASLSYKKVFQRIKPSNYCARFPTQVINIECDNDPIPRHRVARGVERLPPVTYLDCALLVYRSFPSCLVQTSGTSLFIK